MKKVCTKCHVEKCLDDYSRNGLDRHGVSRRRADCKECERDKCRMSYSTAKNRARQNAARRKTRAQRQVRYAITHGKLKRKPCWACGEKIVDAHHLIYSYPLKVVWLCRKHHAETHYDMKYEN